jgi:hypothetical protein
MICVQFVNQILAGFDKRFLSPEAAFIFRPISGMQIFYQVNTVTPQLRIEHRKRRVDMRHDMTAVIQDNVGHTKLPDDLAQKDLIRLIADANVNLVLTELFALRPQVYPYDSGVRAQVSFPHLQGPALAATYLEENDVGIYEFGEMALVNGKVVLPLVNEALIIRQKIRPQAHAGMVLVLPFPGGKGWRRPSSGVVEARQEEENFISNRLSADQNGSYRSKVRSQLAHTSGGRPRDCGCRDPPSTQKYWKTLSLRGIMGHIASDLQKDLFRNCAGC